MCDALERPWSAIKCELNLFILTAIKCSPKDCAGRGRETRVLCGFHNAMCMNEYNYVFVLLAYQTPLICRCTTEVK